MRKSGFCLSRLMNLFQRTFAKWIVPPYNPATSLAAGDTSANEGVEDAGFGGESMEESPPEMNGINER